MEIHDKILELLEEDLTRLQSKITNPYYFIFKNFRISRGESSGIRLTIQGRRLLAKHNEEFLYEHRTPITGKLLLELERKMTWPYYLSTEHISFFSPEDSAWFRLYDCDLSRFVTDI